MRMRTRTRTVQTSLMSALAKNHGCSSVFLWFVCARGQPALPQGELWGGCPLWTGKQQNGPHNWSEWQAAGNDVGSTLSLTLSDAGILAAAKQRLGL